MQFNQFGFDKRLYEGIDAIGFENPTPIQEQAIPVIMSGKDLIASAQTGTGKTAAFLLPIIDNIITKPHNNLTKALVIVPTRELAMQIDQHFQGFSYFTPVSSIAIFGGTDGIAFSTEQQALRSGADVIICTPGRMIAHLNNSKFDFSELRFLILDEADRMLDMGFHDDIMRIISYLPKKRQNMLFSATMPDEIRILAKKILSNPVEISIAVSKPAEGVRQSAYVVFEDQKQKIVRHIIDSNDFKSILIFCSTKSSTKQLSSELRKSNYSVQEIHSDLEQSERENALLKFKSKQLNILVATDILSRGIDIEDIDLVFNYDVPNDGEDYIHRIGRTARAASKGLAITLISPKEQKKFAVIEKLLGKPVNKETIPVQFGKGPEYNPEFKPAKTRKFTRKK